mmetsp:Transcript_18829/g.24446  ORF Transcript_18829/g.24446 Transcript_18829/m.24446 type:complete len:259 (-) Transcript_18829:824-1600(-)
MMIRNTIARNVVRTTLRSAARANGTMRQSCRTVMHDSAPPISFTSLFQCTSRRSLSSYRSVVSTDHSTPVKEGDLCPSMVFKTRVRVEGSGDNPFDWCDVKSEHLFKGKRVVLFALPGAFTPTCSTTHLPGYEAAYDEIKSLDIDEVYCLSVNDAFVMRQWGLHQGLVEDKTPGGKGFKKVKLLPDGAAEFTRGMGMSTMWDEERGFGERSWRYSVVINDMRVEKLFIEGGSVVQNSGPDPFEVSDAPTMIEYLKKSA